MTLLSADIIYGPSETYGGDFGAVFDENLQGAVQTAPVRVGKLIDAIVSSCGIDPSISTVVGSQAKIAAIEGMRAGYDFGKRLVNAQAEVSHG